MKFERIDAKEAFGLLAGQPQHQVACSWSPVIYKLTRDNEEKPLAIFGLFSQTALAQSREAWFAPVQKLKPVDGLGLFRLFPQLVAVYPAITARATHGNHKAAALIRRLGFIHTHNTPTAECYSWPK